MSRALLVNDDLGLLSDVAAGWGMAAREFENALIVERLTENSGGGPRLLPGNTNMFHASHGNLAASGAAISDATLGAARLALRNMRGLGGLPINATAKFLLVPAALETVAERHLAVIYPQTPASVNPFVGALQLVVDPRLDARSAVRWYVFADPVLLPVMEYAYLSGFEGVQVEARAGFDVDGVEIRARLDFGVGGIDHRGAFMNPGA